MIRNGSQTSYFLNGQHLGYGISKTGGSSSYPNPNLVAGTDRTKSKRWFDGTIDEIRIYDRVLSEQEIQILYNESIPSYEGDWIFLSGTTDQDPIFHRGNVAIGTIEPGNYKLTVDGKNRANLILNSNQIFRF